MEKYLETIDRVMFHMKHKSLIAQEKAVKSALDQEHGAGPEAKYIFKIWKESKND